MKDVESFADFIQYYQSHYVLSSKDPELMYFVAGNPDGIRSRVMMTGYRNGRDVGTDVHLEQSVYDNVQFGLPEIGMTVFNDQELIYLHYRTARNGSRGFSRERVVQCTHNGAMLRKHGLQPFNPYELANAEHAWRSLRPTYNTLKDAWDDFESGPKSLAYALSRVFGVYMSAKEHPTLCYRMYEIGDVLGPNKVRLYNKHAEYADPIRRVLDRNMEIEINEAA